MTDGYRQALLDVALLAVSAVDAASMWFNLHLLLETAGLTSVLGRDRHMPPPGYLLEEAGARPLGEIPTGGAWIRITEGVLVCTCGHEQPTASGHEGQPNQTCSNCGTTWWTPCAADCEATDAAGTERLADRVAKAERHLAEMEAPDATE